MSRERGGTSPEESRLDDDSPPSRFPRGWEGVPPGRMVGFMASAIALVLAGALSGPSAGISVPSAEMRGLWVVRTALVSPQSVDRVVDDAKEAGFNALFVQVRGRGDAFYESRLVSRSTLLWQQPDSFDPLARLIARARVQRLEVHAWVNVLLSAHFGLPLPSGHVVREHPRWIMVPRQVLDRSPHREPGAPPPDRGPVGPRRGGRRGVLPLARRAGGRRPPGIGGARAADGGTRCRACISTSSVTRAPTSTTRGRPSRACSACRVRPICSVGPPSFPGPGRNIGGTCSPRWPRAS